MNTIYTVSSLTDLLRDAIEKRLPFVWVTGEVTNLSRPASGHIYFNLKDDRSQLQCVWFAHKRRKNNEKFDPLTGEVYESPQHSLSDTLINGMKLVCGGSMGIYAARGQYQLLVDLAQPVGQGQLAADFERLKMRLAQAGYFAQERKRPLPLNPARIALITSPQGAAIHDFMELAQARGSGAEIRLYPVPVQGEGAAAKIASAIRLANSEGWGEAIVLIRGGGSLEDLWAFNEEELAKAVYESRLPILAGIGHEVDFTLSDLTADVRAATPSHAAQLLWPLRDDLWQQLDGLSQALVKAAQNRIGQYEIALSRFGDALAWLSPAKKLQRLCDQLELLGARLDREGEIFLDGKASKLMDLAQKLESGHKNFMEGEIQKTHYQDGRFSLLFASFERAASRLLGRKNDALSDSKAKLAGAIHGFLDQVEKELDLRTERLDGLDPFKPLRRGYAYIYDDKGAVSSVKQVREGQSLNALLADGKLGLRVTAKERMAQKVNPYEEAESFK